MKHRKSEEEMRKAVSYTLAPSIIALIEEGAKRMGVTKSAFVSYVLADYFIRNGKDGAK